jgi:hypothetical protein
VNRFSDKTINYQLYPISEGIFRRKLGIIQRFPEDEVHFSDKNSKFPRQFLELIKHQPNFAAVINNVEITYKNSLGSNGFVFIEKSYKMSPLKVTTPKLELRNYSIIDAHILEI